ncbi:hypothetical protein HAX54_023584, partial [Datura stramonium]|nr:hypothetical protein [Datura stramonium]
LLSAFVVVSSIYAATLVSWNPEVPDGKILATATSQLKIFTCLDDKKLQKFSGHPVRAVRCMVFSEDGRHLLSSAVGDRHVAVWKLDEGALLPLPKILDQVDVKTGIESNVSKEILAKKGEDEVEFCMEDQLRSLGIISSDHDLSPSSILDPKIFKGISVDAGMPPKKMKAAVLSMEPPDAYNLLKALVEAWQSGSSIGRHVLPWICCIMVNHNEFVTSQEPLTPLLDSLNKLTRSKVAALNTLLQLSGRLQLVMAQIKKAVSKKGSALTLEMQMDESENDEVDEVMYGIDEESQTSSDGDD